MGSETYLFVGGPAHGRIIALPDRCFPCYKIPELVGTFPNVDCETRTYIRQDVWQNDRTGQTLHRSVMVDDRLPVDERFPYELKDALFVAFMEGALI